MGQEPFEEAFERLYPSTVAVARRILGSKAAAEDAAGDAWARALVAWWRVGRSGHADAWVLRVTSNVAIDAARHRDRHPKVAAPGPLETDDPAATRVALVAALSALPRRQREVIVLRHLAGLTQTEVAAALRISPESVKTHAARALAALRADGTLTQELL